VRPVISFVSDRSQGAGTADALVERVRWAARAGVHLVQVRERDLEGGPLTALVRRCVEAVRGSRARVLVNDRVDVALAAGAHGVHLRAGSMPAARVRQICPPGFVVGRSVHARAEAVAAAKAGGLDYLLFGTVFATLSKPGQTPAGPEAMAGVVAATAVPVLAIGGLSPDNLGKVAAAGAAGFAGIGLFAAVSEAALAQAVADATAAFAAVSRP
jgi:thiamine-phosphate pyrophosphorylase